MIRSFRHHGLQHFFETGSKTGILATHDGKLRVQLAALDRAVQPSDMSAPSWGLHPLKGGIEGPLGNYRQWQLAADFDGRDAILVEYLDSIKQGFPT